MMGAMITVVPLLGRVFALAKQYVVVSHIEARHDRVAQAPHGFQAQKVAVKLF